MTKLDFSTRKKHWQFSGQRVTTSCIKDISSNWHSRWRRFESNFHGGVVHNPYRRGLPAHGRTFAKLPLFSNFEIPKFSISALIICSQSVFLVYITWYDVVDKSYHMILSVISLELTWKLVRKHMNPAYQGLTFQFPITKFRKSKSKLECCMRPSVRWSW